ncbi:MAG: hypothetical protein DCF27_13950, partial [Lysobacteraceae bacterium]
VIPMPSRTTPTWEMELLVSGATVFGLMQLPSLVDRLLFGLYNSSSLEIAGLVMPLWVYVKFTVFTLIFTFIAHLFLRGYWVALVGLHSVYPKGIQWDKADRNMGPHYVAATHVDSMAQVIEKADNRATRVFSVGFGLAATFLMPIVLVSLLLGCIRLFVALWGTGGDAILWVVFGVFLLFFLPFIVLILLDRLRGQSMPSQSSAVRVMRATFRFYGALGLSRASNPLLKLFFTNESGRHNGALVAVMITVVMVVSAVQAVGPRLGWDVGSYDGLPSDTSAATNTLLPVHYASQRGSGVMLVPPPHVPDPVVRGRYLRLFVPYLPMRHTPAMQRLCPEALAATGDDASRVRLDCLGRIHALAVDGVPLQVPFDAGEDEATGQRGMVAMIPVAALSPGRHELTVMPVKRDAAEKGGKPVTPYRIPFWR